MICDGRREDWPPVRFGIKFGTTIVREIPADRRNLRMGPMRLKEGKT